MNILAIDTSCDETAVAVTSGRRVLSNVIYSQIQIHKQWGGVVPSLAKRAHEERIDEVVALARKRFRLFGGSIDAVAVTQGPGLAIALEVGIKKAQVLAEELHVPLIAVNHLEGHLYSVFAENSKGNPSRQMQFPYLAMIISGGHTEFVIWKDHLTYEIIGETLDDAAGEALDKAGKLLGLGYPAGAVIERLAEEVDNRDLYGFPRPMTKGKDLQFSFSGLKTAFYYHLQKMDAKDKTLHLRELASSFQEAVFDTICIKVEHAIQQTGISTLVIGGGVAANRYLRKRLRSVVKTHNGSVFFPTYPYLTGDNAAMIGIAASYYAAAHRFAVDIDRVPRMQLGFNLKIAK
jgi:N6-L-threonylcarbamoyladenine synthase